MNTEIDPKSRDTRLRILLSSALWLGQTVILFGLFVFDFLPDADKLLVAILAVLLWAVVCTATYLLVRRRRWSDPRTAGTAPPRLA